MKSCSQRAYSIRTRIKTNQQFTFFVFRGSHIAYSIRTWINNSYNFLKFEKETNIFYDVGNKLVTIMLYFLVAYTLTAL